jgi:hypothetical protein
MRGVEPALERVLGHAGGPSPGAPGPDDRTLDATVNAGELQRL